MSDISMTTIIVAIFVFMFVISIIIPYLAGRWHNMPSNIALGGCILFIISGVLFGSIENRVNNSLGMLVLFAMGLLSYAAGAFQRCRAQKKLAAKGLSDTFDRGV